MTDLRLPPDVDVCWRSLVGETRSCVYNDMLTVAFAFRERVLRPGWWGRDWDSVCQDPSQVNAWGSPANLKVMRDPWGSGEPQGALWRCLSAAYAAVHGRDVDAPLKALTGTGWIYPTHYVQRNVAQPEWSRAPGVYVFDVPWTSAFIFYGCVPGNPPRSARVEAA